MSKQLQHDFSQDFTADIWEVLSHGNQLLITTRDSEKLTVSFSLFNLSTKSFLWKEISFEESWWISVYHFTEGVIIFQTYDDTQNIEARSVFGFDTVSLEAIWSVDQVKLFNVTSGLLTMASMDDPEAQFRIDIRSGLEADESEVSLPEPNTSQATYPLHYEPESPHFETVSRFLKDRQDIVLEGSCDYLEWEGHFAVAANSKEDTGYNLDLFVFSLSGDLLLHEPLEKGLKGLATGTFFIVNQALIFVKGKRNLVVYGF
ncbi:hypothetical protein BFP97_19915 [Roseivirga sp. 4D4]|uniref:DUF4905 domain-containing protein n=1 Tax=Roseivirga sp. 4D4 TaxID=1889784 RepID=UPI000853392A|nr:DUF4905 domain-containing protein [Roseivirga sp. 4D4]OEK03644.1 hypothetical protein BFP97_19915 [Roseivirga sp. 4D4]